MTQILNIAEAKKAVKELEQPILKYQILDILEALEKSVRERTPKCALCDFYEEHILQYKEHYQAHLECDLLIEKGG